MAHEFKLENPKDTGQKKNISGNTMLFIIISCWLLFYVYMGSQGGG